MEMTFNEITCEEKCELKRIISSFGKSPIKHVTTQKLIDDKIRHRLSNSKRFYAVLSFHRFYQICKVRKSTDL